MGIANRNSSHFLLLTFKLRSWIAPLKYSHNISDLNSMTFNFNIQLTLKCHLFAPGCMITGDHPTGIWRASTYMVS